MTEIILFNALVAILAALGLAGYVNERRLKGIHPKNAKPQKLKPLGLTLASGYAIKTDYSGGYGSGSNRLGDMWIAGPDGRRLTEKANSWSHSERETIMGLLGGQQYTKHRQDAAKEIARKAPTYRVELSADRDEADRMQVGEGGELVIAPPRAFRLPKVKPDYGWSIRTQNGTTAVKLTYRAADQVLAERTLPDAQSKEKAILDAAVEALADAVVKYGIDPYPQKTSGPYSDFDGDY